MNPQIIATRILVAKYVRKADTKVSYYWQSGTTILPNRISVNFENEMTTATKTGRMLKESTIGQIRGEFKKSEVSPLKQFPPYMIQSRIFVKTEFPQLTGYGTIAVSNSEGKTQQEEGVIVFNRIDDDLIEVYFVAGRCTSELVFSTCEYVANII